MSKVSLIEIHLLDKFQNDLVFSCTEIFLDEPRQNNQPRLETKIFARVQHLASTELQIVM